MNTCLCLGDGVMSNTCGSWTNGLLLLQWFEEKLQEVESADQQFRKLHALVESLVVHRKGTMSPPAHTHHTP